ncbi:MAG: selenium cofactor biosynthesis protein YqeC [Chloroflexota bacterium]
MGLTLATALRLLPRAGAAHADDGRLSSSIAFVGAGGKTTGMFILARELPMPTLVTCTTHLGAWQLMEVDRHIVTESVADLVGLGGGKVTVVTGPLGTDQRMSAATPEVLNRLRLESLRHGWPLLIEADGAHKKPLKAPRQDEPQLPSFAEVVVVTAGMSGLGRKLDNESVHRPDIYAQLSGLGPNARITGDAISGVLMHTRGGLKGIPPRARRIALLNQADTPVLQAEARRIARSLESYYDAIVISTLRRGTVHAVHEPCAGIVLAAGGATRFGKPKQLLAWRGEPLVRVAAHAAIKSGLSPVIVVTGASAEQVESAVADLPALMARNEQWQDGQASSIRVGLDACPPSTGSAVFLLADQPLITPEVIQALVEAHASEPVVIVVPLVHGDRRGNPVLFDRETFADLRALRGDVGGRAIFPNHRVHYVPWHDDSIDRDIDTQEDYRRLREGDLP